MDARHRRGIHITPAEEARVGRRCDDTMQPESLLWRSVIRASIRKEATPARRFKNAIFDAKWQTIEQEHHATAAR